jgi:hypothetical protein
VSPPSWEPPGALQTDDEMAAEATAALAADDEAESAAVAADAEMLAWSGVLVGPRSEQVAKLGEFASTRAIVPIDMSGVDRIDFVCAGAMLNAITGVEVQRMEVQIFGATPIIRAMLLLIGALPGHFVKKAL